MAAGAGTSRSGSISAGPDIAASMSASSAANRAIGGIGVEESEPSPLTIRYSDVPSATSSENPASV